MKQEGIQHTLIPSMVVVLIYHRLPLDTCLQVFVHLAHHLGVSRSDSKAQQIAARLGAISWFQKESFALDVCRSPCGSNVRVDGVPEV